MYMVCSGNNHMRTWVVVETIMYVCTELPREVHVHTRLTGDINKSYKWSALYLWE
jgi:hypothetical protein